MPPNKKPNELVLWTILPLIFAVAADQLTKAAALSLLTSPVSGLVSFILVKNQGVIMGSLSTLPKLLRVVSLSTAGTFILVLLGCLQFFMTAQPRKLRIGSALLVGGIISNTLDRMLYGSVIDFLTFGQLSADSLVLNFADIMQWAGYILILASLILDHRELRWADNVRKRYWINKRFQLKYCMTLLFCSLSLSLILGVYSYAYLQVALSNNPQANSAAPFISSFITSFVLISLIFLALVFVLGLVLSHRIAGPVFSFSRSVRLVLNGRPGEFRLRNHDEFQELRRLAEEIEEKIAALQRRP